MAMRMFAANKNGGGDVPAIMIVFKSKQLA